VHTATPGIPWPTALSFRSSRGATIVHPGVIGRLRRAIRGRQLSPRTEEAYVGWASRFIEFHRGAHPKELGREAVDAFLRHLAVDRSVSPSTQNQAASALTFLYREVYGRRLERSGGGLTRARRPRSLPTVLSRREVGLVLRELVGTKRLIAELLYGTGLRIREAMELRVKDVALDTSEITVRRAKGARDRVVMIPDRLSVPLRRQIHRRSALHRADREKGVGWAVLPGATARKSPNAGWELAWQFLFPASRITVDPNTRCRGRHHLHPTAVQRAVKKAGRESGIHKRVTCHVFRHSFATHLLRAGYDIRTIQELLGHKSVRSTMIYTHVLNRPGLGVQSPLDTLEEASTGEPPGPRRRRDE